ncbi:MAG: ATP-binding protein [Desulfobacterales bacterium]|nr:ATP-binding protein [Desulfobacterales bacterium]
MRFFNTAGPVRCNKHYCLPPLERFDLGEMLALIEQEKYFVLHAPRQTGKTSCLLALMENLNHTGKYRCLYFNVEIAQSAREDVKRGMRAILNEMGSWAADFLHDPFVKQNAQEVLEKAGEDAALGEVLTRWCQESPKPLVLLMDEVDALVGDTLISVLRQLRAGYPKRPKLFPQSIVLCGVRDVRDYRIHSAKEKAIITGGSAFNIKAKSLRLGDFTREETDVLYLQHTEETGQRFEAEALGRVWELTEGQPWLVNALGYEACFETKPSRDRTRVITAEMIDEAKESIILRRDTHIDQLADKLREDRVRQVIEPILGGFEEPEEIPTDDLYYVRDLGLIKIDGHLRIANRIYQEVIPRELTFSTQVTITEETSWYLLPDGRLDMNKLLASFQGFFREHSEHWVERFQYKEAGPQLLLQAFLQRIVNKGGSVGREYGLGRMRTDLLVIWPHEEGAQKVVLELKILHKSLEQTITQGLKQTAAYMDRAGTEEGHLVIFDRQKDRTWDEKIFHQGESFNDKRIQVWGM